MYGGKEYRVAEGESRAWAGKKGAYMWGKSGQSKKVQCRKRKEESSGHQVLQRSVPRGSLERMPKKLQHSLHPLGRERERERESPKAITECFLKFTFFSKTNKNNL